MILTDSLYFSKVIYLLDPYEGTLPEYNDKTRHEHYFPEQFDNPQQYDNFIKKMPEIMKMVTEDGKHTYVINCWHLNEYESASMWSAYSSINSGIAIQTTYAKLRQSFKNPDEITGVGKVRYLDFNCEFGSERFGVVDALLTKRRSFESENELRAISYTQDKSNRGKFVNVDLNTLIEKIYVSPLSERLEESVRLFIEKNKPDLKSRVIRSELYSLK